MRPLFQEKIQIQKKRTSYFAGIFPFRIFSVALLCGYSVSLRLDAAILRYLRMNKEQQLIVIGGSPGCGKTTLAESLKAHFKCAWIDYGVLQEFHIQDL